MDKLELTKEKLFEILAQEADDAALDSYYEYAKTGNIVAYERAAIVAFLLILVRYKRRKLLESNNMSLFHFFGVPTYDYKEYYELLGRTNLEIFNCLTSGESIPSKPLIEFSEDCAFSSFWSGNFFESLRHCENALSRDENSFMCNFIKAAIVEVCLLNKTPESFKIQLLNYQKELIDRCDEKELNFHKGIYEKVLEIANKNFALLKKDYYDIKFRLAPETFEETKELVPEWTEEHDFYLRHRLFLNPLCNFDLYLESSFEELEELKIEKRYQEMFDEIVMEFKLCRALTYAYCKKINNVGKREMCMVFSYAYSILDKIAYLFKCVYDLNIPEDKVYFTKDCLFDRKFVGVDLCFKNVKNINIYPLFCIMENARGKQKSTDAIKARVFDFNTMRNAIEHRTILDVKEDELNAHSIYLMKYIKEAILHSYMLLHSFSGEPGTHSAFSATATTYVQAIFELAQENIKKEPSQEATQIS